MTRNLIVYTGNLVLLG